MWRLDCQNLLQPTLSSNSIANNTLMVFLLLSRCKALAGQVTAGKPPRQVSCVHCIQVWIHEKKLLLFYSNACL